MYIPIPTTPTTVTGFLIPSAVVCGSAAMLKEWHKYRSLSDTKTSRKTGNSSAICARSSSSKSFFLHCQNINLYILDSHCKKSQCFIPVQLLLL